MKRLDPVKASPFQAVHWNMAKWREARTRNKQRYLQGVIDKDTYDKNDFRYASRILAASSILVSSHNW